MEGLSRSASCIDPARSRTRLLSLLPVSRRLFPLLSLRPLPRLYPLSLSFALLLSSSSPSPSPSRLALSRSLRPVLFLILSLFLPLFLPSFLAPRSSPNPFGGNTACLPVEGLDGGSSCEPEDLCFWLSFPNFPPVRIKYGDILRKLNYISSANDTFQFGIMQLDW